MARHESDREDLLNEVTALSPRVELQCPGRAEPIVAGRHKDGRWSLYLGADPVYHFSPAGQLRRAYVGGSLYRSQGTTLARLDRVRTERETQLRRHDLAPAELAAFLGQMRSQLSELREHLNCGACRTLRQIPEAADFLPELRTALSAILQATQPLDRVLKK